MKSVLQAGWLLTVAFGNVIVLIVAEGAGLEQVRTQGEEYSALLVNKPSNLLSSNPRVSVCFEMWWRPVSVTETYWNCVVEMHRLHYLSVAGLGSVVPSYTALCSGAGALKYFATHNVLLPPDSYVHSC